MERTAFVAVTAAYALSGVKLQLPVMIFRELVSGLRKIIIFVDHRDIQALGAGMAMAAVHASSLCLRRSEIAENRIVTLFPPWQSDKREHCSDPPFPGSPAERSARGFVQRILDALIFRQSFSKGRKFGVQKSSAAEGLHNGNADFFLLAALIEIHTLIGGTDGKIAMAVIIGRIDAEHHHIQKARIQHLIDDGRRVGGKTNVTNNCPVFFSSWICSSAPPSRYFLRSDGSSMQWMKPKSM